MKRNAFNGGELSPAMRLRSDMDVYHRGCERLENFVVGATGGITRRRGMRHVGDAMTEKSKLIPFIYSQSLTYLLELSCSRLIIRRGDNNEQVASFESNGTWFYEQLESVRTQQVNAVLFLASPESPLMQLRLKEDYRWELKPFEYKTPPWASIDYADKPLKLVPLFPFQGNYKIVFPEGQEEFPMLGEQLRVSYYTNRQQAFATSKELLGGEWHLLGADRTQQQGIVPGDVFKVGDKIAVVGTPMLEYFVCVRADDAWTGSRDYVIGLNSPANYGEDFAKAEDIESFADVEPIYGLDAKSSYARGAKIVLYSGYWNMYTCIREFGAADFKNGLSSFDDYPQHFISGIAVGDAMTCKGEWKFNCSGSWVGSYEIRKSDDGSELSAEWETLGESISPIGGASNNIITGEEEEECHLRLFLTKTQFCGKTLSAGFPSDDCSNMLIVPSYKRDLLLEVVGEGKVWDKTQQRSLNNDIETKDWSWAAFNPRFGYPSNVCVHEMRLVLAGTKHQPQTLWFSQTDDLNNFAVTKNDTSALLLTMSTETQEPICWMASRADVLMLGTQDAEWVISSGNASSLNAETVSIRNYGHRGSAPVPALRAENRILYCERGASRVLEYAYQEDYAAYVSTDTTVFADHIATSGGGIVSGTLVRKPDTMALFLLKDGTIAAMTYNTMHNVNAWHRYTTKGCIESICALPNGTREDKLYLVVSRDGKRCLELLDDDSPYADGERGEDYKSLATTTAFTAPDRDARPELRPTVKIYLQSETPARAIRVGTAGSPAPISHVGMLPEGWVQLSTLSRWDDELTVTVSVSGPYGASFLAIQV